jgi:hypothetical protein
MKAFRLARARSGPFDSAARSAVMSEALIKAESNGATLTGFEPVLPP